MWTLVGVVREHGIAALQAYESARALLKKYVHVANDTSTYLGKDPYGARFMTELGVLLSASLAQAALVSRLLSPPRRDGHDDATWRSRHLRQALQFSEEVAVDREARNNLEHIEHRLNFLISHAHTLRASSFSEGFVITRRELEKSEARTGGPTLFCWALIPREMTLITVNPDGTRRETVLPELMRQVREVINRCNGWLVRDKHTGTRQPYRD